MGALSKKIPTTYRTMLIATLAIAGIPPLAGFFSKDEILAKAFETQPRCSGLVGWITAGMTAFYMFRLMFMTFHGESRVAHEVEHHIHESPALDDCSADDSRGAFDRRRLDWESAARFRKLSRAGDRPAARHAPEVAARSGQVARDFC